MSADSSTIAIVGGGPVGALLSLQLARRGFRVQLIERRPDIRTAKIPAGRSINLALSLRGIHALESCHLAKDVLARAIPMYGRALHSLDGKENFQRYGIDDSQYINSISRAELNRGLLTSAEKEAKVEILFQTRVTAFDPIKKELKLLNENTREEKLMNVAFVIACDGSGSVIREAIQKRGGLESTEENLDYGYKELTIPPLEGKYQLTKNALHIWPRGSHMLIALPNFDGSFTCTLFLAMKGSDPSFESLDNKSSVRAYFETFYPGSLTMIERLEDSFFENPTGHLTTVRCRPWTDGKSYLLMGDAAHAIVPFFGQGLNAGFEDCSIFGEILDSGLSLEDAAHVFSENRREDANAIADLALENFIEMRDKVGQSQFLLEKEIERILMQKFPADYVSKYALVTFSREAYRKALRAGKVQDEILAQLSKGLTRAEDVNLELARRLIEEKLSPIFNTEGSLSWT